MPSAATANLFVIGFPRCGTSSLYNHLGRHPDIFAPAVKESHHYGRVLDDAHRAGRGAVAAANAAYRDHYRSGRAQAATYRLDGSATYCWHDAAINRIQAACPEARIIALLRDPVDRAISHLAVAQREGAESRAAAAAIVHDLNLEAAGTRARPRYVGAGRYATHLKRWHAAFGPDNVHVALMEDLHDDPVAVLRGVAAFLHLDPAPLAAIDTRRHNAGAAPRNRLVGRLLASPRLVAAGRRLPAPLRHRLRDAALPAAPPLPMDPATLGMLRSAYRSEVAALPALTGISADRFAAAWPRLSK